MDTLTVLGVGLVGVGLVVLFLFSSKKKSPVALQPTYQPFTLSQKENISHNTLRFRFDLPSKNHILGLPVGKHILLKFKDAEGKDVSRPYTPITTDETKGYFDLVIKVYPGGKMSQHLKNLAVGGTIDIRGPMGLLTYHGQGKFEIKKNPAKAKRVGLIAGGTGITPMFQLIKTILSDSKDTTKLSLIYANVTEEDILLRSELEKYAAQHPERFNLYYTLNNPPKEWKQGSGFVSKEMVQEHLPGPSDDTLILLCGPPPMMTAMTKLLEGLSYPAKQFFTY